MKHYNTGGFDIQLIHCDGEYKSLIDPIRDKLNAEMNFANLVIMYQRLNATTA